MNYAKVNDYDWIKITTTNKREFGVWRPFYNRADDTITGSINEVTKNKTNAPYSNKFYISEIESIEYGSTKEQAHKTDRWFNVFFVIMFIIIALIAYVRECT